MQKLSEEVIIIISNALKMTKNSNYNGWMDKLLFLMEMYPDINIIFDDKIEVSQYTYDHTIYLNESSCVTFLHELTHMFHHLESNFYVPENFEQLANISDKKALIVDLAKSLNEHRSLVIKSKPLDFKEKYFNFNMNNTATYMNNNMIEYDLDGIIQDILDALVAGEGFDKGFTYIKDNKDNAQKSGKICGHGVDYYKRQNSIYKEILANYAALTLINPNYEYFTILKMILGEPLVELLDKEVGKFFSSNIEKVVNNNNIRK